LATKVFTTTILDTQNTQRGKEAMKKAGKWLALVAAAALILSFAACGKKDEPKSKENAAPKSAAGGAPKIVAVGETFSFGKVKQGATLEHIFKIRNEGKANLKITKARGS
jgi:predicted small lipoprotein YifL